VNETLTNDMNAFEASRLDCETHASELSGKWSTDESIAMVNLSYRVGNAQQLWPEVPSSMPTVLLGQCFAAFVVERLQPRFAFLTIAARH